MSSPVSDSINAYSVPQPLVAQNRQLVILPTTCNTRCLLYVFGVNSGNYSRFDRRLRYFGVFQAIPAISTSRREPTTDPMTDTVAEHRSQAPEVVRFSVITVSDTRTLETDRGGDTVVQLAHAAGHQIVDRQIIPDEPTRMNESVLALVARDDVDAILMTGGTGIGRRDQTYQTISLLLDTPLPGYGELFRYLSYQEIGAAAMLSRTIGGIVGETILLTMPGSPAAVRLAMEKLILPEIGHLLREAGR